jgi:NADPH:quinone reductase-like Zn-dependent oxidoreductase
MTLPTTQRRCVLIREPAGTYRITLESAAVPAPGEREVLVRVHAVSLNRRDVYLVMGQYPMPPRPSLVPLSDGAGEVAAVGHGVTRFRVGDRVAAIFFQRWLKGRPEAATMGSALGGQLDGMLSQFVCLAEDGLVAAPAGYSFAEAATLPCAAVTAWNGLVTRGHLQAGDYVLLLGTGGVAIFGLQFAVAAGARPIVTSASDAKLARAKALGATATVNYAMTPEWVDAVRAASGGGVQQVLEVGGVGTLPKSLASLAPGGHVALIGGLAGFGGEIPASTLLRNNATASGIYVGSREHFEAMNRFIERHRIRPVIDRVFSLDSVAAAYEHVEQGRHFGKVVITL